MTFNHHVLKAPLAQYIEAIFHYKHYIPADHSIQRVVPTGHLFLLFELDGFTRHTFDTESLTSIQTFQNVWVSGMHRHHIAISAHEKSEMLVVQFKAHGAFPFFHFPIEQLNEQVVAAETVLDQSILQLRNQLVGNSTSMDKFALVENWLQSRFQVKKVPPATLLTTIQQLQQEPATNFQQVIEAYPNTPKHLITQFKKYVGLTPKYYQRILRFQEILQKIQHKEKITWTTIAYSCGYADQSHFIKEFKHFSGFNPKEFIQQDLNQEAPNFFPLDREG